MSAVAAVATAAATKEAAISFDMLIENKTKEIISIYEEKNSKTKCKKMTADPSVLDFHSKKLINQINAALDKKHKGSAAYKRKCEQELSNALSQQ